MTTPKKRKRESERAEKRMARDRQVHHAGDTEELTPRELYERRAFLISRQQPKPRGHSRRPR